MVFRMVYQKRLKQISSFLFAVILSSCSTIDSTIDSTWDSISSAGEYVYDTIAIWEDEEPEQSEAVVIEEAVEVPEYAMPPEYEMSEENYQIIEQEPIQPPMSSGVANNFYYDPIYRSARQYYYVGPNGTPFKAPPPPPFPQYSIDQQTSQIPYSYYQNQPMPNFSPQQQSLPIPQSNPVPQSNSEDMSMSPEKRVPMLSKEEEMELFGIQNDCIRVKEDYVNGGYQCDDFD